MSLNLLISSIPSPQMRRFLKWKRAYDHEWPINTRSRTYKEIKEAFEKASDDEKIQIIQENTSAIKRPILEIHGRVISVGYNEARFSKAIKHRDEI
jgi:arsenate reductase